MATVLIALKNALDGKSLARALGKEGIGIRIADTLTATFNGVAMETPDVLVFDLDLCDTAPEEVIMALQKMAPRTRIVVGSAKSDAKDAAVIEKGVFYYATGIGTEILAEAVRAGLKKAK